MDGANCLPTQILGRKMTQREAAVEAVRRIGLNQIREVEADVFARLPQYEGMFRQRLALLKECDKTNA
jgi:hypothetical protein